MVSLLRICNPLATTPITTGDKIMEFGRVEYVTEVEAKEIRAINKTRRTANKKRCLMVNRSIEDFQTAKDLGITIKELNQVIGGVKAI